MHNCEGPLEVNSHIIFALDVGGTTVKSALCDLHGQLVSGVNITSVDSRGSRSVILKRFSEILTGLVAQSNKMNLEPVGLAVAFPGPFDYEKGICLIKGVNKYEALYGMDLSGFFRNEVTVTELFPVIFDADSWAFTRGQYLKGAAIGARRIIGITIGTGLGSAFMEEGRIVQNERGIPPYGWIGNLPFGKGILDDRISRRGILARYREISDSLQVDLDVKDLYNLAVKGDTVCMKLFCETGSLLAEALIPFIKIFYPDVIVLGGKISGAYEFIGPALRKELEANLGSINLPKILKAIDPDSSTLSGLALHLAEICFGGGSI